MANLPSEFEYDHGGGQRMSHTGRETGCPDYCICPWHDTCPWQCRCQYLPNKASKTSPKCEDRCEKATGYGQRDADWHDHELHTQIYGKGEDSGPTRVPSELLERLPPCLCLSPLSRPILLEEVIDRLLVGLTEARGQE